MPKKTSKENKTEEKRFEEFKLTTSQGFTFAGRLYKEPSGDKVKKYFMNLQIMEDFSISCHLVDTPNTYFIAFPQYEVKNGKETNYKSYVYVTKDSKLSAALDELSDLIYNTLIK